MKMRIDVKCSPEERTLLHNAVEAANRVLSEARQNEEEDPRWFVAYIELGAEIPDGEGGRVVDSDRFLAGDARL